MQQVGVGAPQWADVADISWSLAPPPVCGGVCRSLVPCPYTCGRDASCLFTAAAATVTAASRSAERQEAAAVALQLLSRAVGGA